MRPMTRRRSTTAVAMATALAIAGAIPAAAQDESVSVVATTEVMGSIVEQLVGDAADVGVVMPGGANPHAYEASARDAEMMLNADILVSNGLDLEEALISIMETAQDEGVTWFQAAEHIEALGLEAADHDHEAEEADHDHDHGAVDPHIWTNPVFMIDVVEALELELGEAGIDVTENAAALVADLEALDAEVVEILADVPEDQRKLVTGHRSMGYFADQYGFELIGTVIPGLTTSGEPSPRELEQLITAIEENGVRAVFSGVGTPTQVAEAVASDSDAEMGFLNVPWVPEGGTYQDLIRELAVVVSDALGE